MTIFFFNHFKCGLNNHDLKNKDYAVAAVLHENGSLSIHFHKFLTFPKDFLKKISAFLLFSLKV